ncbi:MAG: curli assembly protein CsgG [Nitrospinae bacterium]|nr:curli assembly protein CsgG [Nitrospinota bacterium]
MIGDFDCKAASCSNPAANDPRTMFLAQALGQGGIQGVGHGLRNMLMTAVKESGCFKVIDLDQFKQVSEKLAATGQKVKPPKIDYILSGTITSLELSKEGGALGGGFIPVLGMVSKNEQKARMGVDISLMDPVSLEVTNSRAFEANSEKSSWGFLAGGIYGPGGAAGGWSVSKNLALDNVAREVIVESANYVCETLASGKITERPVKPVADSKTNK